MNLDALVRRDRQPWQPCPGAMDLDVWHHYDIPLVGTFRVGASTMLFAALDDASGKASIWTYVELTPSEATEAATRTFGSAEDVQRAVESYFNGREAVVGLASDLRMKRWGRVHIHEDLLDATQRFLNLVLAELQDRDRTGSEAATSVKRAQIEATAAELVGL